MTRVAVLTRAEVRALEAVLVPLVRGGALDATEYDACAVVLEVLREADRDPGPDCRATGRVLVEVYRTEEDAVPALSAPT